MTLEAIWEAIISLYLTYRELYLLHIAKNCTKKSFVKEVQKKFTYMHFVSLKKVCQEGYVY